MFMPKKFSRTLRTARHLRLAQLWARLEYRSKLPWYQTALYAAFIEPSEEKLPQELLQNPPRLWPGDKKGGEAICDNIFDFVGRPINMGKSVRWLPQEASPLWLYHLHYFEWLGDLHAMGNAGLHTARRLIEDWIETCGQSLHPQIWHPYPLSLRIVSWLTFAPWFLKEIGVQERNAFFTSLLMQVAHLKKVLEWDVGGNHLLKNLKALIYIGLCLPDEKETFEEALVLLLKQLKVQVLPDGCHYERSPHYHADVLGDLLDIQAILLKANHPVPPQLSETIDRMMTVLSFFRHSNGDLALFNDGTVGHTNQLAALEKRGGKTEIIPRHLPDAGYVRLTGSDTKAMLVLVDAGLCCPDELPAHAHADMLSFELSLGKEKIFTNSGTFAYQHGDRNRYRGTAAHNTVCINRQDSAEVYGAFRLGHRPKKIMCEVKHQTGVGMGMEASHDGYKRKGFTHQRRLFLSEDGTDLRGEDHILGTWRKTRKKRQYPRAHFHLAPGVICHLKTHQKAEIKTPNGQKLLFKVTGGRLHEADYLYAPHFGVQEKAREIILTADWKEGQSLLKWSLKKES